MNKNDKNTNGLTEHFFRNEYGKIVSVLTKYLGPENIETAEDIVQEALLKATSYWDVNGIPENPQAWLYTTAKNLALNLLKKKKHQQKYISEHQLDDSSFTSLNFSDNQINDEQLKMIFICCHSSISEKSQIALILKILCGFSITEIANTFFTNNETINKRLVRGRKKLRKHNVEFDLPQNLNRKLPIVLKTIYLLFTEGYNPSQKKLLVRNELCIEAIRLTEIIINNSQIENKSDCYSLLALMYFNMSRFMARVNEKNQIIEMKNQDRSKWNKDYIAQGVFYLNKVMNENISKYLILAAISANHCIADKYEDTNWSEILSLYDSLIHIEDSPITRLNRSVALSKVKGPKVAIKELEELEKKSDIDKYYLFHITLAELYKEENQIENSVNRIKKAIELSNNERDIDYLQKKLNEVVPIS